MLKTSTSSNATNNTDTSIVKQSNTFRHISLTKTNAVLPSSNRVNTTATLTIQDFSFLGLDGNGSGYGSSSFGLDNTSFGIVTNSTSSHNRLDFSALHQSSYAFMVDSSLSLGLCDNGENNTKTAKEVKKLLKEQY